MKLQHLRFFAAVIECGSVTRAAERLHVSQPAISAGLKALELDLGQPLFARSGRRQRMVATAAARRFHADVQDILARCEAARARLREPRTQPRRLDLGVLSTLCAEAVAAVAANLMQGADQAWQVREGRPEDLARWLRQGRIDAAWTVVETNARTAAVLWREPFVVLAAADHPLAQRRRQKLTLADLQGEGLVLRGACELSAGRLRAEGIRLPVRARAERDQLAIKLVAQGVGIAVAPQSAGTREAVSLPLADLSLWRSIGLRWRPDLAGSALSALRQVVVRFGRAQG